jgi:hypothetical protein
VEIHLKFGIFGADEFGVVGLDGEAEEGSVRDGEGRKKTGH